MADQVSFGFEEIVKANGDSYWSAREFAGFLGYADYKSFRRAVEKAVTACMRLNIPVTENFRETKYILNGQTVTDTKLSRFACYLVAMNADSRKEKVAQAQVYLAGLAETFREYLEAAQAVDRVVIRGDITDGTNVLGAAAASHGVKNYAFFQNAGYLGMYNMSVNELRKLKRVPSTRSPLDFMYSTELAANLFRITQTTEKIKNEAIMGQMALEGAARQVGSAVRKTMEELSGTLPEDLPAAPDIREAKNQLRSAHRTLKKLDSPSKR